MRLFDTLAGSCLALAHQVWYIVCAMQPTNQDLVHSEAFLHRLMRRQLLLSILCAVAFFAVLLGLPLANYFFPDLMARRVLGFTLTWLVLGILFFPFVWIISWVFIKKSIAMEQEDVRAVSTSPDKLMPPSAPSHPGNSASTQEKPVSR